MGATSIEATVPPLASFGSGGPLEVLAKTVAGRSEPQSFVLHEDAPPVAGTIAPTAAIEGTKVTVTGSGFGRQIVGQSKVLFATPGTTGFAADVESWSPTIIDARVPTLADLKPAGFKDVTVSTAWGATSPALAFELGELPVIESVEPPAASPRAEVEINGHAFESQPPGTVEILAVFEADEERPEQEIRLAMEVKAWSDHRIEVAVPPFAALKTSGPKQVIVKTRWGEGKAQLVIGDRGSITAWTRVEVHARADDLNAGPRRPSMTRRGCSGGSGRCASSTARTRARRSP